MADTNYVTGTPDDDFLGPNPGVNDYAGGAGNDWIDGSDGVNTIEFGIGDGVDTVNFTMPRSYQFADFLAAAQAGLSELSSASDSQPYSNSYFANLDPNAANLLYALPPDVFDTLVALQADGDGVPGSVSAADAKAAFNALSDWITAPTGNVVKFGPGITLNDLTFTLGGSAQLDSSGAATPTYFSVAINGTEGVVFSMQNTSVAGSPALPPQPNVQFQFADGSSASLADVMGLPNQGSTMIDGTEGNDVLSGTLLDDTITGDGGNDQIDGNAGNDSIAGGAGDDVIAGGSGSDFISGNEGNDFLAAGKDGGTLIGGAGSDVYAFNRGDGNVRIDNSGNNPGDTDTLSFGPGIRPQDLVAYVTFGELTLAVSGTSDQVNITSWFDGQTPNPDHTISRVQFVDASGNVQVFDLAGLVDSQASMLSGLDSPLQLFGPGSENFDITASVDPAGGDYALRYALTGSPFAAGGGAENQAPEIGAAIGNQITKQGDSFNLPLPAGAFVDPDGDSLTFAAATADGQSLPAWLNFDSTTGTFSGTPNNDAVGTLSVKVTATDPTGLAATQMFDITVQNVNDAPTLAQHESDQVATQDQSFSYQVPANTFADVDVGDSLTLSAKLANGDALPSWLNFDADTGTFSGTPANADVGALSIQVTATDGSGASASDMFALNVQNVNDAPTLANHEPAQTATQDQMFTYQVPANTFADIDVGDSQTLSATLGNGAALPGWLTFDASTGTFSGTPANGDVGALTIKVTATDSGGMSAYDTFDLTVANVDDAPFVAHPADNQTAKQDTAFAYQLPANTFADVDVGDSLTLNAALSNGDALPAWLNFDAATGTFSGTPGNADVGTLSIIVTATDGSNESASNVFDLTVQNVNDAPVVAHAAPNQTATQNAAFSYTLPADTFTDIDVGDSLTLNASLANGNALPSWLNFNPATGTFSGTPANADVGALSIMVTATDGSGASATDVFGLTVQNVNDAPQLAKAIANQSGTAGNPFTLTVPGDTFKDIDAGDVLKLTAMQANGDPLPAWLTFNPATGTFSGTASAAGQWNIEVVATDLSGATATDVFSLNMDAATVNPGGAVINGTTGDDTLNGTAGNDQMYGNKGKDVLYGNGGDDIMSLSQDATWSNGNWAVNVGSPGNSGSGESVSLSGKVRSYDVFDGGDGYDTLKGTSGGDAIVLDDSLSPAAKSGPRIVGVEKIDAGAGDDVVDLTSKRYAYGDVTIDGGSGNDVLWSSGGNDVLLGGSGNDELDGGAGNDYLDGGSGNDRMQGGKGVDLLQGGSGDDVLRDSSGNGLMDGGSGNDQIYDGSNNSMIVGGQGNDKIYLGGGYDVIAFNRGDGQDSVYSGSGGSTVLSLGGGIRYQDMSLSRSGSDLVLNLGDGDSITFEKWYSGRKYQSVTKLQLVVEASTDYNPGGHDSMRDDKLETFDFQALVQAFDTANGKNCGVSKWTISNALAQFHLGGSDTAALGGDAAYQYGMNGTLTGMGVGAAQNAVGSSQFGQQAQTLHSESVVKEGAVKLA